jgi:RNA polymerase sigma-70 factor, ECF subfamily
MTSDPIPATPSAEPPAPLQVDDDALVARARAGDSGAFELLMRRHNQRVYRVVRSVLRNGDEVEDVMQQAYLAAFAHLDQFAGLSAWSTWLCRIAMNEALARSRQQHRLVCMAETPEEAVSELWPRADADPERAASGRELRELVEAEMDRLPEALRLVLMLREVEGMSTEQTAEVLAVTPEVVKTRLHRARARLRDRFERRIGEGLGTAFAFGHERCDRVVAKVLARLRQG